MIKSTFPLIFSGLLITCLMAFLPVALGDDNAPADFTIHSAVVAANPPHAGFNVQSSAGSPDIIDNIWTADGCFSPMDIRWSFPIDDGSATTAIVFGGGGSDFYDCVSTGFFVGAKARIYRFDGKAWSSLRTDKVTGYTAVPNSKKPEDHTITFASSGPAIQKGDIIWLEMDNTYNLAYGLLSKRLGGYLNNTWNAQQNSTCSVVYVTDGAPGTTSGPPGTNTPSGIKITSTAAEVAGAWQYIQGLQPNNETWEKDHTYQVDVWLKQTGVADGTVNFAIENQGVAYPFNGVTGTWHQFTWQFPAPPGLPAGAVGARFGLNFKGPGTVNVSQFFVHDAATPTFTTDARVLKTWTDFKPSTIRIWGGFANASTGYTYWSLDSFLTAENSTRAACDINSPYRSIGLQEHLPKSLEICKAVGATPWIIASMSWSEDDWSHLIDYLCAPKGSGGYAAYRPADHPNPYTDDFDTIYIEFGNEEWGTQQTAWNSHYGEAGHFLLSHATSNPNFNSKIKFILNGFSGNAAFGPTAIAACPEGSVVDFFSYSGPQHTKGDALYQGDLLSVPSGYQGNIAAWVAAERESAKNGHPYTIAVYEGGPGNDDPNSGSDQGDNSLAAAVGALDVQLYASLNGVGPQNLFRFALGLGTYSSHSYIARGFIPHPVWEALYMRNNYCNGDMVAVDLNTSPVTSDANKFPLTACYAFKDGQQADIVVISRDLNKATPVTLHLPTDPTGKATCYTLTGDPHANNDTALTIPIQTQTIPNFGRDYSFSMPAGSIYIFQVPMAWPLTAPSGVTATATSSKITLSWLIYPEATSYNIYRSSKAGAEGSTPVVSKLATTSYLDTNITPGTTYYYKITAITPKGETDQSNQIDATPMTPGQVVVSIACAQSSGTLPSGWSYDTGFSSGWAGQSASGPYDLSAPNAAPSQIYQNYRGDHTSLTYTVPGLHPNSPYTIRLHFIEGPGTAVGYRLMNIAVNTTPKVSNFDIVAKGGGTNKAVVEDLPATSNATGVVSVTLTQGPSSGGPILSGLQIVAGN